MGQGGKMNRLTEDLVRAAIEEMPRAQALENGEKFENAVIERYNLHMTAEFLVPLLQRAYQHWQHYHPERFEYDEEGNFWPKYYDDELIFSGICKRLLQRRIDRTPELQLDDWGDLPVQLVDPNAEQVQKHYPQVFQIALEYQKKQMANQQALCKYLNAEFGKNIPVENIAKVIIQEIEKNPVLGLPLFRSMK